VVVVVVVWVVVGTLKHEQAVEMRLLAKAVKKAGMAGFTARRLLAYPGTVVVKTEVTVDVVVVLQQIGEIASTPRDSNALLCSRQVLYSARDRCGGICRGG
jgi:hypothetical protein